MNLPEIYFYLFMFSTYLFNLFKLHNLFDNQRFWYTAFNENVLPKFISYTYFIYIRSEDSMISSMIDCGGMTIAFTDKFISRK